MSPAGGPAASMPTVGARVVRRRGRAVLPFGPWMGVVLAMACAATVVPSHATEFTWTGGGATGNWSEGSNWGPTSFFPPFPNRDGHDLFFNLANRLSSTNDVAAPTVTYRSIQFLPAGGSAVGAGAYTISGTSLGVSGTLANSSTNTQTFTVTSLNTAGPTATTVSVTGAPIVLNTILTGSGGIAKTGGGQLSILRSPTMTGATAVSAGTLITGTGVTTYAGPLNVTSTGTVQVLGPTDFAAVSMTGGRLMPGGTSSTAFITMSVDSLALSGSSIVTMGVGQKPASDTITITGTNVGALAYGGTLQLDLAGLGTTQYPIFDATYSLFQFGAGTATGNLASITSINGAGQYAGLTWTRNGSLWTSTEFSGQPGLYFEFSQAAGTLAVVPEPSTYAMAGLGLAGVALMRWRRKAPRAASALLLVAGMIVGYGVWPGPSQRPETASRTADAGALHA